MRCRGSGTKRSGSKELSFEVSVDALGGDLSKLIRIFHAVLGVIFKLLIIALVVINWDLMLLDVDQYSSAVFDVAEYVLLSSLYCRLPYGGKQEGICMKNLNFHKIDSALSVHTNDSQGPANVLYSDDWDDVELIKRHALSGYETRFGTECAYNSLTQAGDSFGIVRLVRDICSSYGPCFTVQTQPTFYDLRNKNVAACLQLVLSQQIYLLVSQYPDVRHAPEVEVFVKCVDQAVYEGLNPDYLSHTGSFSDVVDWVDRRNKLVEHIRQAAGGLIVKRRREHQLRRIRKNLKSVLCGMVGALEKHSKILALRFDVGFHKVTLHPRLNPKVDYATIDAARKKMLAHIRKRFGKALVWYLWKLEYGPEKGFHLHWLVFVNGSAHSHDGHLVKELGEFWNTQVVPNEGVYFNCSVLKQRYKSCGIGPLEAADPRIWAGLGFIAQYLTKIDYYVESYLTQKRRTLGMAVIKPNAGQKPGPKRRSSIVLPDDVHRIVYGS